MNTLSHLFFVLFVSGLAFFMVWISSQTDNSIVLNLSMISILVAIGTVFKVWLWAIRKLRDRDN